MVCKLRTNDIWSVDGTFSVVPRPFKQLYTISYIKQHHVFSCVFDILKNKSEMAYNNLFSIIMQLIPGLQPILIKSDFEIAALNVLKSFFPQATISGCLFHLGQAIIRKVKEFGLYELYKTSISIKKYVKALSALSYVKRDSILSSFNELKNSNQFPEVIEPLYNAFL
jgi:hypothetical protein